MEPQRPEDSLIVFLAKENIAVVPKDYIVSIYVICKNQDTCSFVPLLYVDCKFC